MTMSARRTGALALATLIALTAAACDKGSKSGGGGKGMAGAAAVAPKGGLKRALSMVPANSGMVIAIEPMVNAGRREIRRAGSKVER